MHAALFVCLPRSQGRNSLQARKKVCAYLTEQGFDTHLRFSGCCDYFKVGGRWSGQLTLFRLQHEQPRQMARFWKRYDGASPRGARALFRDMFPDFRGQPPVGRSPYGRYGHPDDAQVMDGLLFKWLRGGFSEEVRLSHDLARPNVIFTDDPDDDFEWPRTVEESAKFWVVVIDYHF